MELDKEKIRTLRLAQDLTPTQLAAKVGITETGLRHLENGKRRARYALAILLAETLGVTLDELRMPVQRG